MRIGTEFWIGVLAGAAWTMSLMVLAAVWQFKRLRRKSRDD